jgi:hypothetical protein
MVSIDARSYFWRYSMNHIPDDLLDLQSRFDQWRANRKYQREPIPDELRQAAAERFRSTAWPASVTTAPTTGSTQQASNMTRPAIKLER